MASKVYFMNDRSASAETSLVAKMITVFEAAELDKLIKPYDVVAIKVHCGEYNNTAYLRPVYARTLADKVKSLGGRPFVCDTTTQTYNPNASRSTALDLMLTAERNGFNSATLGCPFISADGFLGTDDHRIDLPEGTILKETYIAKAIALADVLLVLSHFKGHGSGVFGGAIKNLGIGAQSKRGKYNVHQGFNSKTSVSKSAFYPHLCKGTDCEKVQDCMEACPYGLIEIKDHTIEWHAEDCPGCNSCQKVMTCGVMEWPLDLGDLTAAAIADGCLGAVKAVGRDKVGFVNMAIDVSPWCDCVQFSDRSIVPNLGVFASKDAVAIDKACVDMVTASAGVPGSKAHDMGVLGAGVDKFSAVSSRCGSSDQLQIKNGTKNGLGNPEYELIEVPPGDPRKFAFHWDPRNVGLRMKHVFEKEPVYPAQKYKRDEEVDLELLR